MKKIILALAASIFCIIALVAVKSCTTEIVGPTTYFYGFNEYSTPSSSVMELTTIETAFTDAFQAELGVTAQEGYFEYEGGDANVKKACESAAANLNKDSFNGRYVFTVTRSTEKGNSVVYTWKNY